MLTPSSIQSMLQKTKKYQALSDLEEYILISYILPTPMLVLTPNQELLMELKGHALIL
jgi:hypothetical protein